MQFENGIIYWWDNTAILSKDGKFHILHAWEPIIQLSTSIGSRIFLALDVSNNPTQYVPDFFEKSNCHGTTNELLFETSPLEKLPKYWWSIENRVLWDDFANYHFRWKPKSANFRPLVKNMEPLNDAIFQNFPFWKMSYTESHSFTVLWKVGDDEIIFEKKWYSLPFHLGVLAEGDSKNYRFVCQNSHINE